MGKTTRSTSERDADYEIILLYVVYTHTNTTQTFVLQRSVTLDPSKHGKIWSVEIRDIRAFTDIVTVTGKTSTIPSELSLFADAMFVNKAKAFKFSEKNIVYSLNHVVLK